MIVGNYYHGDDIELGWKQHDVYSDALRIISNGCFAHLQNSCVALNINEEDRIYSGKIDHRTIQLLHDLLAAAWRYEVSPPQLKINFVFQENHQTMEEWFKWLREEVNNWHCSPQILKCFDIITRNQNSELGYKAEKDLANLIQSKFSEIPWTKKYDDR